MARVGPGAILATLAWLLPVTAHAHERSASYSVWQVRADGARVSVKLRARDRDVLRATAGTAAIGPALPSWLALRAGGDPCPAVEPVRELAAAPGWVRYEWRVTCHHPAALDASSLLARVPGHLHVARATGLADGGAAIDAALSSASPTVAIAITGDGPPPGPAGFWRFAILGVEHIAGGADHLLFLFALLLGLSRAREAAVAVTGFTLGHSLTLALVAFDVSAARSASVEALVALSIALVAVDNLWLAGGRRDRLVAIAGPALCLVPLALGTVLPPVAVAGLALFCACHLGLLARAPNPEGLRASVATLFGLLHGLAFAGGLRELTGDVSVGELFGFNAGVELGQLCALGLGWPLLVGARRWLGARTVAGLGSAIAVAAGIAWFFARAA